MSIGNNMRLIGSLTTYPARIDGISATIESILNQTQKLDELVLCLYILIGLEIHEQNASFR